MELRSPDPGHSSMEPHVAQRSQRAHEEDLESTCVATTPAPTELEPAGEAVSDLDREYAENRAEDLQRILRVDPLPESPERDESDAETHAPVMQGPPTAKDWIRSCQRGRKHALRSDGRDPIPTSGGRRKPVRSGHGIAERASTANVAHKKKAARPASPLIDVTEGVCAEIAWAALNNFNSPNVMHCYAVFAVLIDQRTSRESRQRKEIVAYVVRQMLAKLSASHQKSPIARRALQAMAMYFLGERISKAWALVRDHRTVSITAEPAVARRLNIARKASDTPATMVLEALLAVEDKREIVFIVKQGCPGRDVIFGAMAKPRFEWWLRGHDAWPLATPSRK